MASFGNINSEPPEIEQVITEFFAKSLHIVLESRSPYVSSRNYSGDPTISSPSSSSSSSSSVRPRDKWFRLALRDCPAALENIDFWRQSNLEPMVVDVILVRRPLDWDPVSCTPRRDLVRNTSLKEHPRNSWGSEQDEFGCVAKNEKIIERWVVQYETRKNGSLGSKKSSNTNSHLLHKIQHTLYKKSILLLRSLYVTVRLLPAYKLFRNLNSSAQIRAFTLAHRVSSVVEPFPHREEAEMQRFCFTPVDTSCGRLCLSVLYQTSLSDPSSEPSTPMSPQFIADYVGSPMADPLKRFPSLPLAYSPSSAPFSRRHSWSYDLYRASTPSVSFSPSPTHSESRASVSNPASRRLPPMSLPPHPPEISAAHNKNSGFDEYWPSLTFSPSPSTSPPTNTLGSHLPKSFLRSESAPVSIPATKPANTSALPYKQNLPPSPPRGTRYGASKIDRRACQIRTGATGDKHSFGKDETGKIAGLKISSGGSRQVPFSRSSSRMSLPDDFDGSGFICPFIGDDDDVTDSFRRPESYDQRRHRFEALEPGGVSPVPKSQGAEVGALVLMFKTAAPLRPGCYSPINFAEAIKPEAWNRNNIILQPDLTSEAPAVEDATSSRVPSSGLALSKTTADALEELQTYRNIRNSLLKRGLRSRSLTNLASAAESSN